MKNVLKFTVLSLFVIASMLSCDDDDIEVVETLTVVSDSTYSFEATNAREVVISINSTEEWTAICSEDWCTVNPATSDESSLITDIILSIEDNTDVSDRSATLTISAEGIAELEVIDILQLGMVAGTSFNIVGEKVFEMPATESTITVSVETTANWAVIIPAECDWLTASALNGAGDGSVSFTSSANDTDSPRTTEVYFEDPIESLLTIYDTIHITQLSNTVTVTGESITEENFKAAAGVTFNEDGSATLYAAPGTGSKNLTSVAENFSYGKYTVDFSNIQIAVTSSTMLMCIMEVADSKTNGGISWGANANAQWTDGWTSEYWVSDDFGDKKRQRADNDILRADIKRYVIDIKKSADEGMVDVDFYINDQLLVSEQGTDGFAAGKPYCVTFWTYNYYDKEVAAIFEPISFLYEPYN